MDDTQFSLISDMLGTITKRLDRQDAKFDNISDKLVGWDRCKEFRSACVADHNLKFKDLFDRLNMVEETCITFRTLRDDIPSKVDFIHSKESILDISRADDNRIIARLDAIDNKLKFFDVAWWSSCHIKNALKEYRAIQFGVGLFLFWLLTQIAAFLGIIYTHVSGYYPFTP